MSAVSTRAVGKKCWKQHEFVAHGHNVNCLALGPASGSVMVTGGDDRKVNMWMVGKPNVILSLSGHTSPVESVQFNPLEESVVAGSQSGTMKIWDVEAAKITRTLTGHKSSIKSTDFHPYGEYIASGSMDTNVKVWDIRRKGCIMTFKGHTDVVNHLRFSPDGRWIVSAGEDSLCKLWDLTAGKQLSEVKHAGPVNTVEFHPKEFLMATGSGDRTIKFWDLEKICLVSSTDQESNPIRAVVFHPEGQCLFSGANDSLKLYGWEPLRCFDSFSVGWGKVSDMVVASEKLIAASFFQTNASIWVSEFQNVEEMVSNFEELHVNDKEPQVAQVARPTTGAKPNEEKKTSPQRKVFETKRPVTTSSKTRKGKVEQQAEKKPSTPVRKSPTEDNYGQVFTPRSALERSPPPRARYPSQANEPQPQQENNPEETRDEPAVSKPEKLPAKNAPEKPQKNVPEKIQKNVPEKAVKQPAQTKPQQPPASAPPASKKAQDRKVPSPEEPDHIHSGKPSTLVPSERNKPAGLYMEDFLPDNDVSQVKKEINPDRDIPSAPKITDAEAANVIQKGHTPFNAVISNRHRNLNMVWRQWKDGDIKGAVQLAINMNDQSTLVDFLSVLSLKQTLWTLDLCSVVLPNVRDLLISRYESYIQTGASVVKLVLRNFAPVIKSNMAAPPVAVGVDVVREERFQKCQSCHAHLMSLRGVIQTKLNVPGRSGSLYRELSLLFSSLD
ncbi:katanin p80 WD40 repeat-containing subunit B1-like [Dendronephthya gigantea]|uniref:katanin p80 WD40 repeat-containing subunit B1-like n=1 Tax=Dendronephthya gigantea TaxID=151771 RepID=UPI001069E575|nr:katanin p80 WD40 repeat-containing subunit B1-like [Dendronephthya gigantea]